VQTRERERERKVIHLNFHMRNHLDENTLPHSADRSEIRASVANSKEERISINHVFLFALRGLRESREWTVYSAAGAINSS